MKLSELVKELQEQLQAQGDMEVAIQAEKGFLFDRLDKVLCEKHEKTGELYISLHGSMAWFHDEKK